MSNVVENFCFTDGWKGEDILDVLDMAAASQVDENDAENDEWDVDQLLLSV